MVWIRTLGWLVALFIHTGVGAFDGSPLTQAIQLEEARLAARIGAAVIDLKNGSTWHHRGDERFPLNSTHKVFSCAALLHQVDQSRLSLNHTVQVAAASLVTYSPIVEKRVARQQALSLQEACAAAVSVSDNTAANLVVQALGGPSAVTAYMRTLGDDITRLDRLEPELNTVSPGDVRDTTTPNASVRSLHQVMLGKVLREPSQALLTDWMKQDSVANDLLRSVLPPSWEIADKSGAGDQGSRSIIAVIWPSSRPPLVVGFFVTQTTASMAERNAAIARMGQALVTVIESRSIEALQNKTPARTCVIAGV